MGSSRQHIRTKAHILLTPYISQVKEILQEEEDLSEIVQLVGKVILWSKPW